MFSLVCSLWTQSLTIEGNFPAFSTTDLWSTSQHIYIRHWNPLVLTIHTMDGSYTGDVLGYIVPLQWGSDTRTQYHLSQYL